MFLTGGAVAPEFSSAMEISCSPLPLSLLNVQSRSLGQKIKTIECHPRFIMYCLCERKQLNFSVSYFPYLWITVDASVVSLVRIKKLTNVTYRTLQSMCLTLYGQGN